MAHHEKLLDIGETRGSGSDLDTVAESVGMEDSLFIVLQEALAAARAEVAVARQILDDSRTPLYQLELAVKRCRTKKKARIDSLKATESAARAAGIGKASAVVVARKKKEIEEVIVEIRDMIAGAGPMCDAVDTAWDLYLAARDAERRALESLATVETHQREEQKKVAELKKKAKQELTELSTVLVEEKKQKAQETARENFAAEGDEHYDPRYDEREILLRRRRPWV